jgi:hypothetical protein
VCDSKSEIKRFLPGRASSRLHSEHLDSPLPALSSHRDSPSSAVGSVQQQQRVLLERPSQLVNQVLGLSQAGRWCCDGLEYINNVSRFMLSSVAIAAACLLVEFLIIVIKYM